MKQVQQMKIVKIEQMEEYIYTSTDKKFMDDASYENSVSICI